MRTSAGAIVSVALAALLPATARTQSSVGRLAYVESVVERTLAGDTGPAQENADFHIGESLATAGDATARIELPFMHVTLGPGTRLTLPDEFVLALRLEAGRAQLDSPGRDSMTLSTPEAEVRGRGRIVVRREGDRTLVMCHSGSAVVEGAGRAVTVPPAMGTVVRNGAPPTAPAALPQPPSALWPGSDPAYVEAGQSIPLRWKGTAAAHWVELLPEGGAEPLIQRDAGARSVGLTIPWPGAFRWRVAARDEQGLEGLPSSGGMIAVLERQP